MGDNRDSADALLSSSAVDPELVALPGPPRQGRTLSLSLMAVTGLLAVIMTIALRGDVAYALTGAQPSDVGTLAKLVPGPSASDTFVRGAGQLDTARAVHYERPLESDAFQLAPVVGNDRLWVEWRVPADAPHAGTPSAPPLTFVGRLLPMRSIAFGFGGLRRSLGAGQNSVPADAWILVDGATPASSSWTVALALLLAIFAVYNLVTIARILRPVRA